jgi:predicted nucleic acid-binding protein
VSYLLDTNVISERMKPNPDPRAINWLNSTDEGELWLSVVTFAEIRRGIEELAIGRRRAALESWVEHELAARFDGRILGIGLAVAAAWGRLMAAAKRSGRKLDNLDAFLAAIAMVRGLTLVTRNTRHFEALGIALLNPFKETAR